MRNFGAAATAMTILSIPRRRNGAGTRWGSQIAPPMIGIALNNPLYADPPKERIKRPSSAGSTCSYQDRHGTGTGPLVAGDEMYSFGGTESVIEEEERVRDRSGARTTRT